MNEIPDQSALRAHMGQVSPLADRKVMDHLDRHARAFIALSPFLVLATADRDGRLDASPRGDPPGFVRVLDDTTLLLPDRPGNNRVDSFQNILEAPGVGLLFFVPGIEETLRVNGQASLLTDGDALAESEVNGRVPKTGLRIVVEEAYFHCAKALKRSGLWDASSQVERSAFPTLGRILADQMTAVDVDAAEARIAHAYKEKLY